MRGVLGLGVGECGGGGREGGVLAGVLAGTIHEGR